MRSKSWTLNMSGEGGLFQNIPATCHSSMVSLVPVASKAFAAACWRNGDHVGGRVTSVEVKISRKEPEDWRCWRLQESICWKSVPTLNKDTKAFYSVSRFVNSTCWAEVLWVFIYYHKSFAICISRGNCLICFVFYVFFHAFLMFIWNKALWFLWFCLQIFEKDRNWFFLILQVQVACVQQRQLVLPTSQDICVVRAGPSGWA